jgi:hypothetical protein
MIKRALAAAVDIGIVNVDPQPVHSRRTLMINPQLLCPAASASGLENLK